jgi:hypothetical protein
MERLDSNQTNLVWPNLLTFNPGDPCCNNASGKKKRRKKDAEYWLTGETRPIDMSYFGKQYKPTLLMDAEQFLKESSEEWQAALKVAALTKENERFARLRNDLLLVSPKTTIAAVELNKKAGLLNKKENKSSAQGGQISIIDAIERCTDGKQLEEARIIMRPFLHQIRSDL